MTDPAWPNRHANQDPSNATTCVSPLCLDSFATFELSTACSQCSPLEHSAVSTKLAACMQRKVQQRSILHIRNSRHVLCCRCSMGEWMPARITAAYNHDGEDMDSPCIMQKNDSCAVRPCVSRSCSIQHIAKSGRCQFCLHHCRHGRESGGMCIWNCQPQRLARPGPADSGNVGRQSGLHFFMRVRFCSCCVCDSGILELMLWQQLLP